MRDQRKDEMDEIKFGSVEYWQAMINVAKEDSMPSYKVPEIKPTEFNGVDADGFAVYTAHFSLA